MPAPSDQRRPVAPKPRRRGPAFPGDVDEPLGLYLHIPFCSAICNYCNFNRGLFDAELKTRYVQALLTEISRAGEAVSPIAAAGSDRVIPSLPDPSARSRRRADTIYFGGGTPSLLTPEEVALLAGRCRDVFDMPPECEVTLEANPETVSEATLAGYRRAGVNRVSFGVQSFRDDELRRLSRLHGAERARLAYREARRAGFDNVSLDLMMWLPEQRVDHWTASVDAALELAPEHLSLYMLEVYPNAPLRDEMARGAWSQAPDDDVATMYESAMTRLGEHGYRQYELSNVARPGRESRHNLKYWTDGEWLGFGCGAHSTDKNVRWKNVSATEEYIARVASGVPIATDAQVLTPETRLGDTLFLGLRLTAGIDVGAVEARYDVDLSARFGEALAPYVDAGLLDITPERWRLTRRGMLLAHEVLAVFV